MKKINEKNNGIKEKELKFWPLIVKFIIDKNGCCLRELKKRFSPEDKNEKKSDKTINIKTLRTYLEHLMYEEHIFCYKEANLVNLDNFETKNFSDYTFKFNYEKISQYPGIKNEHSENLQNGGHRLFDNLETKLYVYLYFRYLIENNVTIKCKFTPENFKIYLRDYSDELLQKLAVAMMHDCFLSPR